MFACCSSLCVLFVFCCCCVSLLPAGVVSAGVVCCNRFVDVGGGVLCLALFVCRMLSFCVVYCLVFDVVVDCWLLM